MVKIKVIAGSTRPGRFNIQPARWIYDLAGAREDLDVELIDLAEVNLPFLDEPLPAGSGQYSKEHTKRWSSMIEGADGFVFVTPEYNHSYSPVLKNALDFLFREWNYKPATFVSYGSVGGSRAVEHLRAIAAQMKMYDLREQIMFVRYKDNLNEEGEYQFTEAEEKAAHAMLDSLVFWAGKMKEARAELQAIRE